MRAVNLLPKDAGKPQRRAPNPIVLVGAGGGLVVVAGLAMAMMSANGALTEKQDAVADAEVRLASLPEPPPPPSAVDAELAGQDAARRSALSSALATRMAWDALLRRFSLVIPDDVWLSSLSVRAPEAGADAAPTAFTIAGSTYSHDGVARFLSRLSVVPDLANVQLQSSTLAQEGGREIVSFMILADVKRTEVPGS